jgi:L-2-hydroxyglutarate oxidase LhgO
VKQQIELWERELNCVKTRPAIIVLINTQHTAQKFIEYCRAKNLEIIRNHTVQGDREQKKFVLDLKHEREAMEFQLGNY